MKIPAVPSDEVQRLRTLHDYDLLDTPPEQALDDLTALAAQICGVPIALVSLVDAHRQWFKSKLGLTVCETPRDISFCGHAILEPRLFLIPDATLDERFADNPLVTGESRIRFYAGAPLTTPSGETLGALCVMDRVPRQLSEQQQQSLLILARQVMSQLELRRQTRELRESEARLQTVTENARVGLFMVNHERRYLYANQAYAELVERPRSSILGALLPDLLADIYETRVRHQMDRAFAGERVTFEVVRHFPDGPHHFSAIYEPRITNGSVTLVVGVITDITARKQIEVALQRSEADLQLALQAARLGRWNWDIITGEVTWSPECLAIYGLPPDASMDYARFLSILHPEDRPTVEAALAQAVEKRAAYDAEKRVMWPDGSLRWTASRGQVYCNAANEPIRLTGVTFDITQHKQAEAALREALERFQIIARATNDAVWDWNLLTDAVWWNEGFQTLFGYPAEKSASTGKAWISLLHPDERERIHADVHKAIHRGEQAWIAEYRFRRQDGTYAYVLDRGYIIRDEHGKPVRMIGAMQDITERKRAEERAQWLATFPERNPNPVLELDLDSGVFNYLNPAALRQFPDLPARGIHHPLVKGISEFTAQLAEKKTVHREHAVGDFCFSQMITYLPDVERIRIYNSDITERRKAEINLLEAHRLAKLGNWEWDMTTGEHRWSPEIFAIYGRDPALGPAGVPEVSAYFTPESWATLNAAIQTGLAKEAPYEFDAEVVRSDGTHRWVTARGEMVRDAVGKVTGMRGTVQDITERKEVEEALRLRQKYAHGLLQFSQQLERAETFVQVLQAARTALQSALGFTRIWFYQLSADQQHLKLILADSVTGHPPGHQPEQLFPIKGDRMLEEIASSRDIVVVTDARTDPRTDKEIVA
ncbi:MAG: histidine kinase, partial [Verrucomicrobia bacterium]|nr:histidine kinase [Verrucomicrobiota bacterium]